MYVYRCIMVCMYSLYMYLHACVCIFMLYMHLYLYNMCIDIAERPVLNVILWHYFLASWCCQHYPKVTSKLITHCGQHDDPWGEVNV